MKTVMAALMVSFFAATIFAQEKEIFPRLDDHVAKKWFSLSPNKAGKYENGFVLSPKGKEIICDNGNDMKRKSGAFWPIILNQKDPVAITVSAESCSEGVGGSENSGYSLYLDVYFMDGSSLWGQKALFNPFLRSTWHERSVTIVPDRPIRRITAYVLFRGVKG